MNYFAQTMQLSGIDYKSQVFEKYGEKYFDFAVKGEGLGEHVDENHPGKVIGFTKGKTYLKNATDKDGNIIRDDKGNATNLLDYSKASYISLIEAGSILEDALFPDATTIPKVRGGDGRFNNHFYSAQFYLPKETASYGKANLTFNNPWELIGILRENQLRKSDRASVADSIADAYGQRTDAVSWALDPTVVFSVGVNHLRARRNDYNLPNAFEYYRKSFVGTKEKREKNQAKLFVSLGHVLHLLEDMHSPGHVRNGSHPGGDYLEIFSRHTGGFFLRNGQFSAYDNNVEITKAVEDIDVKDIMLNQNPYSSYESFMVGEALWVSENFFSEAHSITSYINEDHVYTYTDNITNPPGVDLSADGCGKKNTTIFDIETRNPSLAESNTNLSTQSFLRTGYDSVLTNGNASSQIRGDISNETVVAFEERKESSLFGTKCRSMAAPYKYTNAPRYYDYNKRALIDTAKHVIPRAVASVQAFTNFFFRGRMEAHLSFDNEYIIVQNTSVPDLVGHSSFLTFRADVDPFIHKSFKLYYVKDDGEHIPLYDEQVSEDNGFSLDVDMYPTIPNTERTNNSQNKYAIRIGDLLAKKGITIKPGDNKKLILVFDGKIGDEALIGLDNYNIGSTRLSATYVKKSLIKKTVQYEEFVSGDDGTYRKGVPGYFIRNPLSDPDNKSSSPVVDTVLDVVSGLMWQDDLETQTIVKPWVSESVWALPDRLAPVLGELDDVSGDTAYSYCSNLSLGGYDDWRLPHMHELVSLLNEGGFHLKNTNNDVGMWSVDPYRENFGTLDTSEFGKESRKARVYDRTGIGVNEKRTLKSVRCVRTIVN